MRKFGVSLRAPLVTFISLVLASNQVGGSYLDVPRIHFVGQFRADVSTRNNFQCNYNITSPVETSYDWNVNGTGEFEFVDVVVTSVVDDDGNEIPNSPLLGANLFSNENQPFAKIVDFNVDYQVPSVFGLKVGLRKNNRVLFRGTWAHSVLAHEMWLTRIKCVPPINLVNHSTTFSTHSSSRITNITWLDDDEAIQSLKVATGCPECTGELSTAITLFLYSQDEFTKGQLVGSMSVAKTGEPLSVAGERVLLTHNHDDLKFPPGHACYNFEQTWPWTYTAPFKLDLPRSTVVLDLSNSLPLDELSRPIDFGRLWLAVVEEGNENKVKILGDSIPYTEGNLWKRGAIFELWLDNEALSIAKSTPLVIVAQSMIGNATQHSFQSVEIGDQFQVVLSEDAYYIRPIGCYVDRLEYAKKDTSSMTLLVTFLGQPASGVNITVNGTCDEKEFPVPADGVTPVEYTNQSDKNGLVTFTFKVRRPIPFPRQYTNKPCEGSRSADGIHTLPIDGQVYNFVYCVAGQVCELAPDNCELNLGLYRALLTFLAYSTYDYREPYTWVDHVQSIFSQMNHLYHVMGSILDLSNFTEVTLPRNKQLLSLALTKDFFDINYMPVTRDIAPTSVKMIVRWLDNPIYSTTSDNDPSAGLYSPICHQPLLLKGAPYANNDDFTAPPRCAFKNISFSANPLEHDLYFQKILDHDYLKDPTVLQGHSPRPLYIAGGNTPGLKELNITASKQNCTVDNLRKQLQMAVQLEFATIPLYLTSLYSIKKGCNCKASEAIRSIVMQEMLHMTQAANLLISVGGKVSIDDPDFAPSYPTTGLPGGVLPNLYLSLKRFNLSHIYDTFMAVEIPTVSFVIKPELSDHTIGQFYKEIEMCLGLLGDEIFDPGSVSKQVKWPWQATSDVGTVHVITDLSSALDGLNEIVEQGEGAGPLDPMDGNDQLAHFYRFEEIVCQKGLVLNEGSYEFTAPPIPYEPHGVWRMRDNPTWEELTPGTDCHREAKVFHHSYRALLHSLQSIFDGAPDTIKDAIVHMESLQVQARKTMAIPFDQTTNCGPVWDYTWY